MSRRRWLIWGIGVLAYAVAVFHRFSLGVTGIEAGERLDVGAAALGLLSLTQLAVYAVLQVPAGVLLDRLGSRRLLVAGAVLMSLGQVLFAFAGDLPTALIARLLLGSGDALTFISVLRIIALWFPSRQNPLVLQLTAIIGQLGAVVSAVPLIGALRAYGWTASFMAAAAFGAIVGVVVWTMLRDAPRGSALAASPPVRESLRSAWAEPGTRLGMWTHFVTQFPGVVFVLLWGYPYLVHAQGVAPETAGLLLTLLTLVGLVCSIAIGSLVSRYPFHRTRLALSIVSLTAVVWTVVLLWPGQAPLWLLVVLVLSMAANGPGSAIGFDVARTSNPAGRLGTASGIVNVGGFTASFLTIALIGITLNVLADGATTYGEGAFRWAFAMQYPIWLIGVTQVLRYRRRARAALAERDPAAYDALRRGVALVPAS
jgi:sugar phosphate permease